MDTESCKVLVQTDDAGRVTAINSDAFVSGDGWTQIDEGEGDRYNLCQSNYFDSLYTDGGIPRYKYADGAAVLVALNRLMGTDLSTDQLCDMGVQIGADVPFCIVGGTCLAQGIGEVLSPLKPMPSCHIVLAKPDFGVNTGKAYGLFDTNGKTHNADQLGMLTAVQNRDLAAICGKLENVFEQFVEVPGRIEMKEVLRAAGAAGVCMSGSGPTLFGIFSDKAQALAAARDLAPFAKDIAVTKPVRQGCKIVEVISDCG